MASSSRKKLDEKNVKILRDLASLPHNKYCFDCNQRGPTYVNVTIGSFVCTKCSGMLRGLTPPHRVKSISMASFSPEEIELLRNRGNEYCRRTWLGLYESTPSFDGRDEQAVRDFMTDKYERNRYYLDPSVSLENNGNNVITNELIESKQTLNNSLTENSKILRRNREISGNKTNKTINNGKMQMDFVADFGSADIYNSNKDNNNMVQLPFANFDNNLTFNSNGLQPFNGTTSFSPVPIPAPTSVPPPPEDRYAALKDLDNALKVQSQLDWNSGSDDSLPYASFTPTGSLYSSTSSRVSAYNSPNSPSQFGMSFLQDDSTRLSNPFNNSNHLWSSEAENQVSPVNPFRAVSNNKMNGMVSNTFGNSLFQNGNGGGSDNGPWVPNPFKIKASTNSYNGQSNNPFL